MKKLKRDEEGQPTCPKCRSKVFVGKSTIKGKLAGGFLLAPTRMKCAGCGHIFKPV